MIVSATGLANDTSNILDRVVQGGEVVEVQRYGRTVAVIHAKVGVNRSEAVQLLSGRGLSQSDSQQLHKAMDAASEVFGYAGSN
jgi:antitoxin (DNA-binding transcriptional repressor) of toxin-antitoxin stability system